MIATAIWSYSVQTYYGKVAHTLCILYLKEYSLLKVNEGAIPLEMIAYYSYQGLSWLNLFTNPVKQIIFIIYRAVNGEKW